MNGLALPLRLALKNPKALRQYLLYNKRELSYWGLLVAGVAMIYFAFSDGEFSFCYTLSAIIQAFGFAIIALKVFNTGSVNGLSLNTFICYSVSLLAKLFSITFYYGYRPSDASGDLIFRVSTGLAFIASLASLIGKLVVVQLIKGKFNRTYNESLDRINCFLLIIPTLVLACLVHPTLNDIYGGDIPWTFSLYLEIVAMLPQLYMLSKKGGEIEAVTSHFVASQGFSLCLATVFWLGCYHEVNEAVGTSWTLLAGQTGYVIILCQLVQVLFFSDFLFEYIKSMKKGLPMMIGKNSV